MKIMDLTPAREVALDDVAHLAASSADWKMALPKALPDDLLLQIAQAFHGAERDVDKGGGNEEEPATVQRMSVALLLTTNLLFALQGNRKKELSVSAHGMRMAMRIYCWALENEIACRATGVRNSREAEFLDGVRSCLKL